MSLRHKVDEIHEILTLKHKPRRIIRLRMTTESVFAVSLEDFFPFFESERQRNKKKSCSGWSGVTSQQPRLAGKLALLRDVHPTGALTSLETVLGKENCGRTNWKIYFMSVCCRRKARCGKLEQSHSLGSQSWQINHRFIGVRKLHDAKLVI